jgi:hypothetical protein
MDDHPTRKCAREGCENTFVLALRQRGRSKQRRYCSDLCRAMASRAARDANGGVSDKKRPASAPIETPSDASFKPRETVSVSGQPVAPPLTETRTETTAAPRLHSSPRKPQQMVFGDHVVEPDAKWPRMYRVRRPDGTLTDMVNLTRARDAARTFADQACLTHLRCC